MKSYKTKEELLNHLKVDRHLELEESLIPIFDVYRYGQVIDAYKDLLAYNVGRNHVHLYSQSITLSSFINAMNIDEYISTKLIVYISHYEKILKKYISDKVCESMVGFCSIDCCDYSCFKKIKENSSKVILECFIPLDKQYGKVGKIVSSDINVINSRLRVINKILDFSCGDQNNELNYYANDYYNTKHVIPFYILVGSLSFTNLTILFEMLSKELQIEFIKRFHHKTCIELTDIVATRSKHFAIRRIRNIIHHHEPVVPYLYKSEYLSFEIKKEAIKLLNDTYTKCNLINNLKIQTMADLKVIEKYQNSAARKVVCLLSIIK